MILTAKHHDGILPLAEQVHRAQRQEQPLARTARGTSCGSSSIACHAEGIHPGILHLPVGPARAELRATRRSTTSTSPEPAPRGAHDVLRGSWRSGSTARAPRAPTASGRSTTGGRTGS
jgi:hypothetical protein